MYLLFSHVKAIFELWWNHELRASNGVKHKKYHVRYIRFLDLKLQITMKSDVEKFVYEREAQFFGV